MNRRELPLTGFDPNGMDGTQMAQHAQTQHPHKQHQEPAPGAGPSHGNVIDTANEGVHTNGSSHVGQMAPDVLERLASMSESPLFRVDSEILGEILWKNGFQQEARALRRSSEKEGFLARIGGTLNQNVTFKHLAVGFVVGSLVYVVYEGIAAAFDLPSFEIIFKQKPEMGTSSPTPPPGTAVKR